MALYSSKVGSSPIMVEYFYRGSTPQRSSGHTMDKRYQVFVSSTYADLKEERQQVIRTVMDMDCIPAGMELFPAADEEQFQFIKRVIDDCDYYLLIIGGRYGSTDETGISYTEKEYEYSVSTGLKVIALIHKNPDDIAFGKSEQDPQLRERLGQFRTRVSSNRLVQFWESSQELPGLVAQSLAKTMKMFPAVGWVRANKAASEDMLVEINDLRKENANLRKRNDELSVDLERLSPEPLVTNLAELSDEFSVVGKCMSRYYGTERSWSVTLTWAQMFAIVAPYLEAFPTDEIVKGRLKAAAFLKSDYSRDSYNAELDDQLFRTIALQLKMLKLVDIDYKQTTIGTMALFWSLTPYGKRLMIELRTVKKSNETGKIE